jgi:opacity protein-like surface antigen
MQSCRSFLVALVMVLAFAAPLSAAAQRLSISPEIGFYIPTENLVEIANGTAGELEAGPSFGLRLLVGLGRRVSLSVGGAYVPTTFEVRAGGGPVTQQDARLFTGAGQLVLYLIPPTSPLSVFLNGGVGVVSRGGVAFTDDAENSNVSGVLGAGATIRLGGLAVTAGADAYSYKATYEGATAVESELTQLDISLRLGLGVPFGGGAMGRRR